MKASIVIPLFNKSETIHRALYSALDQTDVNHTEFEIIVVDDGSNDSSVDVVNSICEEHPTRNIKVYQQPNSGVSTARNQGVSLARGEVITFLDADDSYKPHFLSTILRLRNKFPTAELLSTAYDFVNTDQGTRRQARSRHLKNNAGEQIIDDFFAASVAGDLPFCASSFGITKRLFNEVGGFPENENMGEDQDLYAKAALNSQIAHCSDSCANYFLGVPGSLMNSVAIDQEMPYSRRLQKILDQNKAPTQMETSIKRYIAGHLTDLTRRSIAQGHLDVACDLINDPRVKILTIKYLYWNAQIKLKRLQNYIGRTKSIS